MEQWQITRNRLYNAVLSHQSVANGDLIYQYLEQLVKLATNDQKDELERCHALVQNWSAV